MRTQHYAKLDNKKVVPVSFEEWVIVSRPSQVVQQTRIGDILVSTIFLGINHGWYEDLWFETMIFGGHHDEYQERYSTWEEAEAGHEKAVNLALNEKKPEAGSDRINS